MLNRLKNPNILIGLLFIGILISFCPAADFATGNDPLHSPSGGSLDGSKGNPSGTVSSNVTQSANTMDVIVGNPQNVEAVNGIVGTNMTIGIQQIREATMPGIATTSNGRNLPLTLFETYANTAEKDKQSVQKYNSLIDEIRDALREGNYKGAYDKLLVLKDFDFDGGISENIRNRVKASMEIKTEINKLEKEIDKLEREKRSKELLVGSQLSTSKGASGAANNSNAATGNSNVVVNTPQVNTSQLNQMLGNAYRATRREEDRIVAAGKIGSKELEKVKKDIESRQSFRAYIASLMESQQFTQAVVGIEFYRTIYNDGDYTTELAIMYNKALEANKQAKTELEAFNFKNSNNELAGASEKLLAAFMMSKNLPDLLIVPRNDRRRVSMFLRNMSELESLLMVKDYNTAEEKIQNVKKEALDFDFSKAMALINNGKMQSNFALGMAKLSAQQGKLPDAQKYFYGAAELWPTNPDLKTASQTFFTTADTKEQYIIEFDRYWTEENWRALYENRLKYPAALDGDKPRIAKFEKAMRKVEVVEVALLKAEELSKAQNPAGAWEVLEKASIEWSDDPKLNKAMAELSGLSSDFIKAVKNARNFEAKEQWGASLTWYLQAQAYNPMSEIAKAGIDKTKEKILTSGTLANKP